MDNKELDFTINYWKSTLPNKAFYNPTAAFYIERTIFYLEELAQLRVEGARSDD